MLQWKEFLFPGGGEIVMEASSRPPQFIFIGDEASSKQTGHSTTMACHCRMCFLFRRILYQFDCISGHKYFLSHPLEVGEHGRQIQDNVLRS
jgi:hypothetical protein